MRLRDRRAAPHALPAGRARRGAGRLRGERRLLRAAQDLVALHAGPRGAARRPRAPVRRPGSLRQRRRSGRPPDAGGDAARGLLPAGTCLEGQDGHPGPRTSANHGLEFLPAEVVGSVVHAAGGTRGTNRGLGGEGDEPLEAALRAADSFETAGQYPAVEICAQVALDEEPNRRDQRCEPAAGARGPRAKEGAVTGRS